MTPRSPSGRLRAPHTPIRRCAALTLAVVAISATPLVTHALGTESTPDRVEPTVTVGFGAAASGAQSSPVDPAFAPRFLADRSDESPLVAEPKLERIGQPSEPEPVPSTVAEPEPTPDAEPAPAEVDPSVQVLIDSYDWDERGARVEALQQLLGVSVDGWYGAATARAHRSALEVAGLPTDDLPEPVLPPGPSAEKWAALRDCEAGGDYTITNPSGTYRGAYQFNRSTWDSVAGRHAPELVGTDPATAAPADQDAMALALWHERGSAPWPHCGRHLG